MKKNFFALALFALFFSNAALFAQAGLDPLDDFYEMAMHWHIVGFVEELPQLKPYPLPIIKKILLTTIEKGEPGDVEAAQNFYELIFGRPWHVAAELSEKNIASIEERNSDDKSYGFDAQLLTTLYGFGDIPLGDYFSTSWRVGTSFTFFNLDGDVFGEKWAIPRYDTFVKTIETDALNIDFHAEAVASYVSDKISASVGWNRTGFGFFLDDDTGFSPTSRGTPQITFSYNGKRFDFTQYFGVLEATDFSGEGSRYGKFMSFHSLRVALGSHLHFTFYDSVIYGKRFDPTYFIPVPSILISAANGHDDNVISGIAFDVRVANSLLWSADFSVDHLDRQQLLRLRFNGDNRIAFKTGLVFSPTNSICKMLSIDYTIVGPYTYSYANGEDGTYNFSSYTNAGRSIGTWMPPNSDRAAMRIKFEPIRNLIISSSVSIARHGNVYESYSNEEMGKVFARRVGTKGDAHSPKAGTDSPEAEESVDYTAILSQDHIMYVARGGIDCTYTLPRFKAGTLALTLGFAYIYMNNVGVDSPIYSGNETTDPEFTASKSAWVSALHDEYDVFFSFGVKYTY